MSIDLNRIANQRRTMMNIDSMPKRNLGRVCLGLPLLYGLVPVIFGSIALCKWAGVSSYVIGFNLLFVLGGTVMVSSAIWLLFSRGRVHLPFRIGVSILDASIFAWAILADLPAGSTCELDAQFRQDWQPWDDQYRSDNGSPVKISRRG
jgi:hypothetical protein